VIAKQDPLDPAYGASSDTDNLHQSLLLADLDADSLLNVVRVLSQNLPDR
jgi:hypothetical protein